MRKLAAALMGAAILSGGTVMAQDLTMVIDGREYQITLVDNEYSQDLVKSLPATLTFENFGRNERIAYLDHKIGPSSYKESLEVKRGDLCYYVPWGNLCAFRVDYSSPNDLAPIGHMSEEAIKAVEGSGDREVQLLLAK